MASSTAGSSSGLMATSSFTFGRKSTTYSAPRYSSVCPFWRPNPLTSVTVSPCTPTFASASRTSSSLNGLMMAVTSFMIPPLSPCSRIASAICSDRIRSGFPRADANDLLQVEDEDLAVADLAGPRGFFDGFDDGIDQFGLDCDVQPHFRSEIDGVLRAPVQLRMAFLPAEALHLGHREALDSDLGKRVANFFELERLNDGCDQLHRFSAPQL